MFLGFASNEVRINCYKCAQTILPSGKCYKNGSYFGEVEACPDPQHVCYKEVKGKINLCLNFMSGLPSFLDQCNFCNSANDAVMIKLVVELVLM